MPAEELYFLTRRLQRAVYEYLLSLDALPEPPQRREGSNGHNAPQDATLIGAEEIAALGRNGHVKTVAEPAHVKTVAPETEPAPEVAPEQMPEAGTTAADRVEAGLAELDAQLSPDEPFEDVPVAVAESEADADAPEAATAQAEPATRPAFTLFRRTGAAASKGERTDKGAAAAIGSAVTEAEEQVTNGLGDSHSQSGGEDPELFVKPKDGFHLSDLADFAVVQRSATAVAPEEATAGVDDTDAVADEPAPSSAFADLDAESAAEASLGLPDAPNGAAARGWRLRDDEADQSHDLTSDPDSDDTRFETDPEVVEARLEINDRLRRRRCDEAAALLQRLANDVGGRALAELALDAGDRCRALGKGNAALSCYLAASRADPVHETPLLRLADICIDDHDIDLAVSYLERVTRLRRLRNDDKGALKLYRKIVTIAPYRDDILAMLMRAQANGRFDE